jgi:hypothetical protein
MIYKREKFENEKGECLMICCLCQVKYYKTDHGMGVDLDDLHRHEEDPRSVYYINRNPEEKFDFFSLYDPITEPLVGKPGQGWDPTCVMGGSGNSVMLHDPPYIAEDGSYINKEDWESREDWEKRHGIEVPREVQEKRDRIYRIVYGTINPHSPIS